MKTEEHLIKKDLIWTTFTIAIVILTVFGQALHFNFLSWDDPLHITDNQLVKNFSWIGFFKNLDSYFTHTWLTHYIWGITHYFTNGNPLHFHFLNIVLHIINSIFVYILTKKILQSIHLSFIVAILFATHPVHVEAVVWASAFKDILFSFFYLICILIYINYLKESKFWKLILLGFTFFLASSSKIQALHLPLVLISLEYFFNSKIKLKNIIFLIALFILGIKYYSIFLWFFSLLTFVYYFKIDFKKITTIINHSQTYFSHKSKLLQKSIKFSIICLFIAIILIFISKLASINLNYWDFEKNLFHFSFSERVLMSGYALTYYLKIFLAPINLIAVHPYPNFNTPGTFESFLLYLAIYPTILITLAYIALSKKTNLNDKKTIILGTLFFLINISFVLHIIPIHGRLIVADRYSYLAIWGLFIALFPILMNFFNNKKSYIYLISIPLFIFYSYQSFSYSKVWSESHKLYDDIITKNPKIAFAYNNKALLYFDNNNYQMALENYALAISADSAYYNAYYNRALLHLRSGELQKAQADFNKAILHSPINDPEILTSRGWNFYLLKEYNHALNDYNKALFADSTYTLALNNRALLKFEMGDFKGAFLDVNNALEINPKMHEAYNNRGWFKLESNDLIGAMYDFEQAYLLNPKYSNSLMNLAWTHFLNYNYQTAAKYYKEAYDLNPNNTKAIYYLGLCELNRNNYNEACFYLKMAQQKGYFEATETVNKWCKD